MLYTETLVVPLLVTATRVPEAFQLAEREAEASQSGQAASPYVFAISNWMGGSLVSCEQS